MFRQVCEGKLDEFDSGLRNLFKELNGCKVSDFRYRYISLKILKILSTGLFFFLIGLLVFVSGLDLPINLPMYSRPDSRLVRSLQRRSCFAHLISG